MNGRTPEAFPSATDENLTLMRALQDRVAELESTLRLEQEGRLRAERLLSIIHHDTAGNAIDPVASNRDSTARLEAAEALHASEARYRTLFDHAPIALWEEDLSAVKAALDELHRAGISDLHDYLHTHREEVVRLVDLVRVVDVNTTSLQLYGALDKAALLAGLGRIMGSRGLDTFRESLLAISAGHTYWSCEAVNYTLTGERIDVVLAWAIMPGYEHTWGKVLVSISDISAQKHTEEILARSEAQLAGIINSAMDAIVTLDAEHRIILFNRAAERIFGCTAAEVLGQALDRFIPQAVRNLHRQHITTFKQKGVSARSMKSERPLMALRADGTEFPIEASISQATLDGQTFATVILRDITERRRLEAQLAQAQKMESIGRLAGGVAHDFNNLLTVINGCTELARESLPTNHPAQNELQEIAIAVGRAADMSRQLLTFARKQRLEPQRFDLNALIQETEKLLRRLIGEDIQLATMLGSDLTPVQADPGQLQQVLINLAINARDAMPNGGLLRITTTVIVLDTGPESTHLDLPPGPYVRIAVSDTGIGMSQDVQSRLFEPFFTTKEPGKGTGLGLATSYGIVRQHGGSMCVRSEMQVGTTMDVYLPATQGHHELTLPANAVEHIVGSETLLLVEDDDSVRNLAERTLAILGYRVLAVDSAEVALELVATLDTISLLLTDIVLPGISGYDLSQRVGILRPQLKVVYMSGYGTLPNDAQLDDVIHAPLIRKPFSRTDLARTIRAVLDEH